MRVHVYFDNIQDKFPVGFQLKALLRRTVRTTLKYEGIKNKTEVSVTFADDESIRKLNAEYRNLDRPTDVLSFPIEDDVEAADESQVLMLGDIVISLERAAVQAEEYGHGFKREVAFLCAHSMLHLLGYDHELGEEQDVDMRRRQREIMKLMGLEVK